MTKLQIAYKDSACVRFGRSCVSSDACLRHSACQIGKVHLLLWDELDE